MTDQYSLFPTYLKELQTEAAEKKRIRLEELQQVDFLKTFEKEWIESDLIKHNVKAKSWFVISYQEKMRQQKLITSKGTE